MTNRIVRRNVDLSGQTLTVDARESLLRNVNLTDTTIIGDIRGTDFLNCDLTRCDLSQAQTYGSMWRGCIMRDAVIPLDIGWRHHEPVAEIIRQRVAQAPVAQRQKVRDLLVDFMAKTDRNVGGENLPLYVAGSWDTTGAETMRGKPLVISAFQKIFAPYSQLTARLALLVLSLGNKEREAGFYKGEAPTKKRIYWDDGAAVDLDLDNLPSLAEMSRYALRQALQAEADTQRPGAHYCFVYGVTPPVARRITTEDEWLTNLVSGLGYEGPVGIGRLDMKAGDPVPRGEGSRGRHLTSHTLRASL